MFRVVALVTAVSASADVQSSDHFTDDALSLLQMRASKHAEAVDDIDMDEEMDEELDAEMEAVLDEETALFGQELPKRAAALGPICEQCFTGADTMFGDAPCKSPERSCLSANRDSPGSRRLSPRQRTGYMSLVTRAMSSRGASFKKQIYDRCVGSLEFDADEVCHRQDEAAAVGDPHMTTNTGKHFDLSLEQSEGRPFGGPVEPFVDAQGKCCSADLAQAGQGTLGPCEGVQLGDNVLWWLRSDLVYDQTKFAGTFRGIYRKMGLVDASGRTIKYGYVANRNSNWEDPDPRWQDTGSWRTGPVYSIKNIQCGDCPEDESAAVADPHLTDSFGHTVDLMPEDIHKR